MQTEPLVYRQLPMVPSDALNLKLELSETQEVHVHATGGSHCSADKAAIGVACRAVNARGLKIENLDWFLIEDEDGHPPRLMTASLAIMATLITEEWPFEDRAPSNKALIEAYVLEILRQMATQFSVTTPKNREPPAIDPAIDRPRKKARVLAL